MAKMPNKKMYICSVCHKEIWWYHSGPNNIHQEVDEWSFCPGKLREATQDEKIERLARKIK
ncbi:MAG: hypothetical protein DWQ19_08900 [Crenarchaeota archaeon]|nr:MAG: hypothetical protein DWQ19_08900 [Thermoproteota archaeon]